MLFFNGARGVLRQLMMAGLFSARGIVISLPGANLARVWSVMGEAVMLSDLPALALFECGWQGWARRTKTSRRTIIR